MQQTGELTKQDVETYVKENGFFPKDAPLKIIDIVSESERAEGFVNLVYRVLDTRTGRSLIARQIMPYMLTWKKKVGEDHSVAVSRMDTEVRSMVLMREIFRDIAPEVYRLDRGLRLILMEDVGRLEVLRFSLAEGNMYPDFGVTVGGFLAGMRFFTSDLFLGPEVKARSEKFFDCRDTKPGMIKFYFSDNNALFDPARPYEDEAKEARARLMANEKLKRLTRALGGKAYDADCVCHSDFTAGNVMVGPDEIRVIDFEFAGYGPAFLDIGKMTGSFLVNYVSWLGMPDVPLDRRMAIQRYDLQMVADMFNGYLATLKELFALYGDRPGLKKLRETDPEKIFRAIYCDSLRCGILAAALRIPTTGGSVHDIARIKNPRDLGFVQKRFLELSEYVLEYAELFRTIEAFCEIVHCCAGVEMQ